MKEARAMKIKPDIRAITRLVPPSGNLVQGQSELPIDPRLAGEAARVIAASQNHYGPSEGDENLRRAVAEKIRQYNGIEIDMDAKPLELMVTNGGTGALIGVTQSFLQGKSALVFEPYYPYHRRILEEFGGKTETFELDENLGFEKDALLARCRELKDRSEFPLRAIIVCTPANPSGKVMTQTELEAVADVAKELDLLVYLGRGLRALCDGREPARADSDPARICGSGRSRSIRFRNRGISRAGGSGMHSAKAS